MGKLKLLTSLSVVLFSTVLFNSTDSHAISQSEKKELVDDIRETLYNYGAEYKFIIPNDTDTEGMHRLDYVDSLVTPESLGYDSSYYLLAKRQIAISNATSPNHDDVVIKMHYYYDAKEYSKYRSHIKEIAKSKKNLSHDEKIKFVNDYLVNKTNYDSQMAYLGEYFSPIAILKEGKGEAHAYALFAYDLFAELGVENYLLEGTWERREHLWNVLKDASGNIVHLDTMLSEKNGNDDYYMVSTNTISKTHKYEQSDLKNITAKLKATPNPAKELVKQPAKEKEKDKPADAFKLSPSLHSEEFFENIEDVKFLGDAGKFSGNKIITLKFKERVGSTASKNKNYFVADEDGYIMNVKINVASKIVRVTNTKGVLKPGVKYYLVMPKDTESDKSIGKYLKDTTYATFTIK